MFLSHKNGPLIARIPKNASQTIGMALAPSQQVTNEDALERDIRVMFIRDPFDRLASAYSFFSWLRSRNTRIEPEVPVFKTYEQFIDWALDSDDSHVTSQVDCVTVNGVFVPNRIHWLKDIVEVWNDYYPGLIPDKNNFPHRNNMQRLVTTDYRRDDIRKHYARDFEKCPQR